MGMLAHLFKCEYTLISAALNLMQYFLLKIGNSIPAEVGGIHQYHCRIGSDIKLNQESNYIDELSESYLSLKLGFRKMASLMKALKCVPVLHLTLKCKVIS